MAQNQTTRRAFLTASIGLGVGTIYRKGGRRSTLDELQDSSIQWPQFQYDATNTGYNSDGSGPTESVAEKWSFKTNAPIRSAPAVGHGSVFVGSNCGRTFSIAAESGKKQWETQTGLVDTGVALYKNRVYVSSQPKAEDSEETQTITIQTNPSHLRSLFAGNGTEIWNVDIGTTMASSPTITGGVLYVCGDSVYAVDVESGADQWVNIPFPKNYVPDRFTYRDTQMKRGTTPAVTKKGVFVSSRISDDDYNWQAGTTGILQPKSGKQRFGLWSGFSSAALTIARHSVIANEGDLCVAQHAGKGNRQWEFRTGELIASPAVANGTVYVASKDSKLYALSLSDGSLEWLFPTDGPIRSSPAVANNTVYFGTENGTVHAVNAESGKQRWTFDAGGSVRSSPAVAKETVYVGSDNGRLYALGEK